MKYNRFEKFKALFHSDKLDLLSKGGICTPASLVVYPSYRCNYSCNHCIMREERKGGSMLTWPILEKLANDCRRLGIESVCVSGGGEPLTNIHTLKFLEKCKTLGIETSMNTNGQLLTDASNVDHLRISIDAGRSETYAKVHGVDAFDEVAENIKKSNHNELGLAFLITPYNCMEVVAFCEWAQQFDYTFLHIRPAHYPDNRMKDIVESLKATKEAVKEYRDTYFKVDKFDGHWTPKLFDKCRSTPLIACLCADGQFSVCQDNFIKFGDYYTQSFEECWFGEEHYEALRKIDIHKCPRCVEVGYNEIIQQCFINDELKRGLL